jgi:hypothetical protein
MDIKEFCNFIGVSVVEKNGVLYLSNFSEKYIRTIYNSGINLEYFSHVMKNKNVDIDSAILLITQDMNTGLIDSTTEFNYFINCFFPKKLYRQYKIQKLKNGH